MRSALVRVPFLVLLAVWLTTYQPTLAQEPDDFLALAIPLAVHSQRTTTVPASVTLAQAMFETGRGKFPIDDALNYFGIKAGSATGDKLVLGPVATGWVWAWTKEWDGTKYVERREKFRKYASMEDSFRDHGLLLATTPRYAHAMLAVDDPREFARRIAAAGYATSPTYAADLIRVMDRENLYQYDLPRNSAMPLDMSDTVQVRAGEIFQIYFDVKNIGFGTWSSAADYALVSANANRFGAEPQQHLDALVQPEEVKRFRITMIAPDAGGTYTSVWQLKHGAQNFGPPMSVRVEVQGQTTSPTWVLWVIATALVLTGLVLFFLYRKRKGNKKALHTFR